VYVDKIIIFLFYWNLTFVSLCHFISFIPVYLALTHSCHIILLRRAELRWFSTLIIHNSLTLSFPAYNVPFFNKSFAL